MPTAARAEADLTVDVGCHRRSRFAWEVVPHQTTPTDDPGKSAPRAHQSCRQPPAESPLHWVRRGGSSETKRYRSSWSESATGIAAAKTTAAATVDEIFVCSRFQISPAQTAIAVQTRVRT